MPATYEKIATQTLGSSAATVTFSSIAGTYTDLVLVFDGKNTAGNRAGYIRFNGDSGSNYSNTSIQGDGSAVASGRNTSATQVVFGNVMSDNTNVIFNIQNYSNTTTYKTLITRANTPSTVVQAVVGLWRSTSAITSIALSLNADSYATGSTFTLYGIKSA